MGNHRPAAPDIERVFQGKTVSGLSEWQLLARYLEDRDEIAFEALVARHGPMVMGTCRRMLARQADVEDAFQATFLVLVRRARSLGPRDAIGPWLHGVAARVSLRARSQAARRRQVEPVGPHHAAVAADSSHIDGELAAILDQEVNRLPAKYRSPIILCYLQSRTHEEAARQLKWPLGTVKGRLARARDLLRSRLLRRGIAPSMAVLGGNFAREARAALDREFLEQTVRTCMKVTLGQASIDAVSISIASLVKGALSAMIFDKLKWAAVTALATGVALTGAVVVARQAQAPPKKNANRPPARSVANDSVKTPPIDSDVAHMDVLVNVADVAKAHIEDLRNQLVQAARNEWTATLEDYRANQAPLDRVHEASKRLMNSEEEARGTDRDRAAAAAAHLDRMRELARVQDANPSRTKGQAAQVRAYAAEAELWKALASSGTGGAGKSGDPSIAAPKSGSNRDHGREDVEIGAKATGEHGQDPKSKQIIAKLEDLVAMKFPDETPLSEVIKHIKEATRSSDLPGGVPIYVDRIGLEEADKTLDSVVTIDLEGVPLRRTLQLALAQLELAYFVEDGMVYITYQDRAERRLPPPMPVTTPLSENLEKAERGELTLDEMKTLIEMMKTQNEIQKLRDGEPIWGGEGPDPRLAIDEAKQTKELIESLVKELRSLTEVLKLRK